MQGNSEAHLQQVIQMIQDEVPFSVIRPSDGEFHVLSNRTLTNIDKWTFQSGGLLQQDLMRAVCTSHPNLFIGIPCNHCSRQMCSIYKSVLQVPKDHITYANLFCNSNWKPFISFLKSYTKGFYVVTSGEKETNEFSILGRYLIDPYLVNQWDTRRDIETPKLFEWISSKKNQLILFCAGPLAKVWIANLVQVYPDNIYLDIGSVLDLYLKGTTNRHYAFSDNNELTRAICDLSIE
jgi:hypothetical protein